MTIGGEAMAEGDTLSHNLKHASHVMGSVQSMEPLALGYIHLRLFDVPDLLLPTGRLRAVRTAATQAPAWQGDPTAWLLASTLLFHVNSTVKQIPQHDALCCVLELK